MAIMYHKGKNYNISVIRNRYIQCFANLADGFAKSVFLNLMNSGLITKSYNFSAF